MPSMVRRATRKSNGRQDSNVHQGIFFKDSNLAFSKLQSGINASYQAIY